MIHTKDGENYGFATIVFSGGYNKEGKEIIATDSYHDFDNAHTVAMKQDNCVKRLKEYKQQIKEELK